MQSVNYEVEYMVSEIGTREITGSNAIEEGVYLYHELVGRHLLSTCMPSSEYSV